jgi:hypothetical protein
MPHEILKDFIPAKKLNENRHLVEFDDDLKKMEAFLTKPLSVSVSGQKTHVYDTGAEGGRERLL